MIAAVVNLDELERSIIFVVIEPENLKRMRKGDPATLETVSMGGILPDIKYPKNHGVLVAYEEDEIELYKKARSADVGDLLRYLERGRKFIKGLDGTQNAFVAPRDEK